MRKKGSYYHRPRLDKSLNKVLEYPLSIVVAGAGYGKTTTVKHLLEGIEIKHVWVPLTSGDDQLLWEELCHAIIAFSQGESDELTVRGIPKSAWEISRFLRYLTETCTTPRLLVFDDWQHLSPNSPLQALVEALAFSDIKNLHILLLTRSLPQMQLSTLITKQRCLVIDEKALCFTETEITGYLELRGLSLTEDLVSKVHEMSQGWISAIYLIGEAVRSGEGVSKRRTIDNLFEEVFMERLTPSQRDILIRLSAFDQFSAEMASVALGNQEVQQLLEGMMNANAFIILDSQDMYHLHPLLRDYLSRLRKEDTTQKEIYRRVGLWGAARNDQHLPFSIVQFQKAGCVDEYLSLVNQNKDFRLDFFDMDAIGKMVDDFPDSYAVTYPLPYLKIIFYLFLSGKNDSFRRGMRLYKVMRRAYAAPRNQAENRILGELLIIARIIGFEPPTETEVLEQAAVLLEGKPSYILRNSDPFTFGLPFLLDSEYLEKGTLDEAVKRCQHNPYELVTDGFGRGSEALVRAEASLFRCHMDEANIEAQVSLGNAKEKNQYFVMVSCYFVLMRRALFLGKKAEAKEQYAAIRQVLLDAERTVVTETRVTLAMLQEAVTFTECFLDSELDNRQDIPPDFLDGTHKSMMVGFGVPEALSAMAMYRTANLTGVLSIGERFQKIPTVSQNARLMMLLLTSMAQKKLNMAQEWSKTFDQAIDEAKEDGVTLPFAETPDCLPVVEERLNEEENPKNQMFLSAIKEACLASQNSRASQGELLVVELSPREIEVLRLTAEGKIRRDIAKELDIREDTVKKHQMNTYAKLRASNKTEAINIAKANHII